MTRNAFLLFSQHSQGLLARKQLLYRMVTFKAEQIIQNLFNGNFAIAKIQYLAITDFFLHRFGHSSRFN